MGSSERTVVRAHLIVAMVVATMATGLNGQERQETPRPE